MMKIVAIATLLLLSASFVFCDDTPSDVVILTEANFDESLKAGDWLLEFYAPWCGHCKKLVPTYEEVATEVKGKVNIAKIDCTVERDLATRFGIRGFPTLKFFHDGKLYDYRGARTKEALIEFVTGAYSKVEAGDFPVTGAAAPAEVKKEAAAPAAVEKKEEAGADSDVVVLTDSNFDTLTAEGDWLLEFYAPWCGHCKKLAPTFDVVASELKGKVRVGKVDCTVEKEVGGRFGIRGYPTLKFLSAGTVRDYKGDRSKDDMIRFATNTHKSVEGTPAPKAGEVAAPAAPAKRAEVDVQAQIVALSNRVERLEKQLRALQAVKGLGLQGEAEAIL